MRTSANTDERGSIGLLCWIVIAVLGSLIAVGIVDNQGRKDYHHVEPLPSTVHQLSARAYLVENEGPAIMSVCRGTPSGEDYKVEAAQQVPGMDAQYIECSHDQYWNVDQERSKNFAHSAEWLATRQATWVAGGLLTFICFLPWTLGLIRDRRNYYAERAAKAKREREMLSEGQEAKRALTALWASDEIDDLTFESKLQVLLDKYPELSR